MTPENVQVGNLKSQMQPDIDFFKKLLKDNQAQEICKNLGIYPSLQEEFINFPWIAKSRILKQEDSPSFNC